MKSEVGFLKISVLAVAMGASAFTCGGSEEPDAGPSGPPPLGKVTIRVLNPKPHTEVRTPVTFEVEVDGAQLAPANQGGPGKGYLVIAIDGRCTAPEVEIPKDARHVHLLDGAANAPVNVPLGMRDVCVQVAYSDGRAYDGATSLTLYVY